MALTPAQLATASERRDALHRICSALPEVDASDVGESHTAYRVGKRVFAYHLHDHHGDGRIAVCVKSTRDEQGRRVREEPDLFYVPAYLGPAGWVSIRLDGRSVPWDVVRALVREAYLAVAPQRLAAAIDGR